MSGVQMIASCASSDLDLTTGVCSNPMWVPQSVVGFPPLTAAQGAALTGAIAGCWVLGFMVRIVRKTAGV